MTVSHLSMFYDTRQSVYVENTNPCNNPNTELNSVPEKAEIKYPDQSARVIGSDSFNVNDADGYKVAKFLISRAMYDPDAVVIPA